MSIDVLMRVVIWAVPVLFSIVVHEVSHGWMAHRLGDDTAKRMGRLTLNPLPHIDPMGTVILPLIMIIMGGPVFGWAKPVPFNPYNFNRNVNIRNGTMWVALAGPGSNVILAFIFSFVFIAIQQFFSSLPFNIYSSILDLSQHYLIEMYFFIAKIIVFFLSLDFELPLYVHFPYHNIFVTYDSRDI